MNYGKSKKSRQRDIMDVMEEVPDLTFHFVELLTRDKLHKHVPGLFGVALNVFHYE